MCIRDRFCAPNTVLTPHLAWATPEALGRLAREVCRNLAAFMAGTPRNICLLYTSRCV